MTIFITPSIWFTTLISRLWLLGLVMGLTNAQVTFAQGATLGQAKGQADGLNAGLGGRTTQSESLAYSPHEAVGPIPSRVGSVLFDGVVPSGLTRTGETLLNTVNRFDCPNLVTISGNTVLTDWEPTRFTASAEGENITYQWQQSTDGGGSFSDLPDQTNSTFSFDARMDMNGHQVRVIAASPGCPPLAPQA